MLTSEHIIPTSITTTTISQLGMGTVEVEHKNNKTKM